MITSNVLTKGSESLQGKEFVVVGKPTMVPAFEILRAVEDYLVLSTVICADPDKARNSFDPVEGKSYGEYVDRRSPYIRNPVESQLPGQVRRLYTQIVESLRGTEWKLRPIDPCYADARDEILRELTTIGITQAAWFYIVDNLPADTIQLKGALLVIMPEKMKNEWKEQANTKLNRIGELVSRLRFLMMLSRSRLEERDKTFQQLGFPRVGKVLPVVSVSGKSLPLSDSTPPQERNPVGLPFIPGVKDAAIGQIHPGFEQISAGSSSSPALEQLICGSTLPDNVLTEELPQLDEASVDGMESVASSRSPVEAVAVVVLASSSDVLSLAESELEPPSLPESITTKVVKKPPGRLKKVTVVDEPQRRSARARPSKK